jgi:FkbM family methyltransferase
MSAIRNPKLIVDVGMSEGNDTDFYLKKGFRVVGIEADPAAFQELASRFAESIARNELVVLNCAAHSESDRSIEFVRAYSSQGHSHIFREENNRDGDIVTVSTIAWSDIISIAGIPYYCKIDIEGSEENFLVSIANSRMLPEYISVECHGFAPIEGLTAQAIVNSACCTKIRMMRLWRPIHRWRAIICLTTGSCTHRVISARSCTATGGWISRRLPSLLTRFSGYANSVPFLTSGLTATRMSSRSEAEWRTPAAVSPRATCRPERNNFEAKNLRLRGRSARHKNTARRRARA